MAGYVPPGKNVKEWTTIPQPESPKAAARFGPVSSGSTINYNQPWPGDAEARPGTMARVASSLQQNIGNYLLFRAVLDLEGKNNPQQQQQQQAAGTATPPTLPPPAALGKGARPHGPSGPAGAIGPTTQGLGPGPTASAPGSQIGSAAPLGPTRSGQAPDRGIEAARNEFTNKNQTDSALFPREAFAGPIALGPRAEDRRPKGRDTRAKNRFVQGQLF